MLNVAVHIEAGFAAQNVFRLGEDIFDKRGRNDAERNFTVDAAEGEVVDLVAKRRNVRPLAGIKIDRQHIFAVEVEVRSQVETRTACSRLCIHRDARR